MLRNRQLPTVQWTRNPFEPSRCLGTLSDHTEMLHESRESLHATPQTRERREEDQFPASRVNTPERQVDVENDRITRVDNGSGEQSETVPRE